MWTALKKGGNPSAYQDDDLIFAAPDGSPVLPWTFTASFRYLVDRAKVPYIRLHDLRDTHASLLGTHRVPLEVVSKRLGHATIGITAERYLHVYRERDAEGGGGVRAARRLARLLENC